MIHRLTGYCLCAFLLVIPSIGNAQFGVGARMHWTHQGYWNEVFEAAEGEYPGKNIGVYAMYWFRLKEKRVEFLPEVGYFFSKSFKGSVIMSEMRGFSIQLNTDIYFLDLANDCNCPTFSKQDDFFKRGVFVEVSPGVELRSMELQKVAPGIESDAKFKSTVPTLYAGLGLDIGLSDLVTITPVLGLQWAMSTQWDVHAATSEATVEEFLGVDGVSFDTKGKDNAMATRAGLRILFRPDYLRRRR